MLSWPHMVSISLLPGRTGEKPYYFGSPLPLKSQPKIPDSHERYLLLSVSDKIKWKNTFTGERLIAGSFVLPCRFGLASLKEESMKVAYTRLSQSTIHKVVTISLLSSQIRLIWHSLGPKVPCLPRKGVFGIYYYYYYFKIHFPFLSSPSCRHNPPGDWSTGQQHWWITWCSLRFYPLYEPSLKSYNWVL